MKDESEEILRLHALWLRGDRNGKRANLSGRVLSRANLSGARDRSASNRSASTLPKADPQGVVETLRKALEMAERGEFESVLVIAFNAERTVWVHGSRTFSAIEQVGMLEMAKWDRLGA